MTQNEIIYGNNLPILERMPSSSVDLIYIDPPFNTGKTQVRHRIATVHDEHGNRIGFQGRRYRTEKLGSTRYKDSFDNYLAFLRTRVQEGYRILRPRGSFFFHIDYREVHYCKVMLDDIFGRDCFQNEIIWAYDYGARSKSRWPAKHDNILWYTKHPTTFTFNMDACERIPYICPGLMGPEESSCGKTPTDVWWHTIVQTNGKEKTGYATQKPLGIIERIVKVHSNPGDVCLDFFAGSGTFGEAAAKHARKFILIDDNPEAIVVMESRLKRFLWSSENGKEHNQPCSESDSTLQEA